MRDAYLDIIGLDKTLGAFHLGPVSLKLEEGEYAVLLGPTGCGKTSLLRAIAGTLGHAGGEITLRGEKIDRLPSHKRGIGYVSQTGDLFPHLTVRQNIAFGTKYLGISRADARRRVTRFLELFDLTHLGERYPEMLSGGEVKRAAMARSLITEPRLLLLDEPLGMLDYNAGREVLVTLKIIHDELRTTTIHVTHDRHEAWSIAQTCAVMNRGRILQKGSVAELFRQPGSRFVAEFLGGINIFSATFTNDTADVGWAKIPLAKAPPAKEGCVLIRPESIRIVSGAGEGKVSGAVELVRDFGEFIEVQVRVCNSGNLCLHSPVESSRPIEVGDEVFLDWPDESAHAIIDD